jgi:hypothetical protein
MGAERGRGMTTDRVDRIREQRFRVATVAEAYVEAHQNGGDDQDARRRLLRAVREHGEIVRSEHRARYRHLLEELEDDREVLLRYAGKVARTHG